MPSVTISGPKVINYDERATSRSHTVGRNNADTDVYRYVVYDAADELELKEAMIGAGTTPAPIASEFSPRGLYRDGYEATWIEGSDHWEVDVYYVLVSLNVIGANSIPEVGSATKRFTTSGENLNIKTGISLVLRKVPNPTGPLGDPVQVPSTPYEMIGDTGDKEKEPPGIDIIVPVHSFAYDFTLPASDPGNPEASLAYIDSVRELVGTVNNAAWKEYTTIGSVLFTGFRGSIEYGKQTTLSFEFSYIESKSFSLPPAGNDFEVRGWEYVDIKGAKRFLDPTTKKILTEVTQVDVWQVYPYGDFSILGIP